MKIPTQAALDAKLKYWQRRLRLQDWDVKVRFVRMSSLDVSVLGTNSAGDSKREADIRLLHPADIEGQNFWDVQAVRNWERVLVHELLHLHMHDILPNWNGGTKRAKHRAAERMIDAVSIALVPDGY